MAGDDDDKTVFGQKLPPAASPRPAPGSSSGQNAGKTVFGAPLPPQGGPRIAPGAPGQFPASPPQQPSPPPQPTGWTPQHNPGKDDTWLGGALAPQTPPYQPPPSHIPEQSYQPPPAQHHPQQYRPQNLGQAGTGPGMFPDIPSNQAAPTPQVQPRIALHDALRGTGLGKGGPSNPLLAAAANLLILLGRLRTGLVELQSGPLMDHVTREIDEFERAALQSGVSPQDASDAKYSLSATADDIVQNLPGADKGTWLQYSMVARFFGERSSGVGFFQKLDEAMRAPAQRFYLLELMLVCLSLGFEGQYRTAPNGSVDLARIRNALYETLRRVQGRPDDDISVKWTAVPMGGGRRYGGTPVWVVGAVAAMMVVALFATLSTLLTRQSAEVRESILALHPVNPDIVIERTEPVTKPYIAPESSQLERIREGLANEIASGAVEVDRNNAFIFVRVGDYLRFGSGSAELESEFATLASSIARTLENEQGAIRVVGHTDSVPVSGRGRYKSNEELSVARARTVADHLGQYLQSPDRLAVEGKGAVEPIADNETREGRALNRRVEIMIPREDTL